MKSLFHKNRFPSKTQEHGFTLIEVMIAMVVFTIGTLAVSIMSVRGFNSYTDSRNTTTEVNRSIKNIDALSCSSYNNNQVFAQGGQSANYPYGADQADLDSWDFDNIVVNNTKLIAVENTTVRGPTASDDYRLYMVKSQRTQVQ